MPKSGDLIKVSTEDREEKGILMPSPDENAIIIKLDNGYNMGFERKEVQEIVVLEKKKAIECKAVAKVGRNKELPTIAILHTGGTIASKVDYETGAVTAKFTAKDLLEMFPELSKIANIETELVSNMMSEDMNFSDHVKIAKAVQKQVKKGVDGIIIGHGTDTMGFTAASLASMLEKIDIPVLLVGSQRSLDRGSTDATQNLICAAEFITRSDFAGVAVCMHHCSGDDVCAILPATKTRKMHTSRRDAFQAINDSPIALVDYNKREVEFLKDNYQKKCGDSKVVLKDKFEDGVGLLKVHPNMRLGLFEFFAGKYKAFVIEGTGLGHAPTNKGDNLKNFDVLKEFIKKGGIVAVTSQCLFGRVHPYVYTNLRRLSEIGCIFCEDMLPETAFVKLTWLLGNYPEKEVPELMRKNLRGEISESTGYEETFLKDGD